MSLTAGRAALESELFAIFNDVSGYQDARLFAQRKAKAIHNFVLTPKPMTIITTFGGSVSGAMTAGPVQGTGLGGFDKPAPGMTLISAHPLLISELIGIYTHGNANKTAADYAQRISTAIYNYFSQAAVMTLDKTDGPLPAPPPVGPVTGPIKGKGGLDKPSPGAGYDAVVQTLEDTFYGIFTTVQAPGTVPEYATRIGDAIHAFCKEGRVETQGTFVAPAAVAIPPAPPEGAYFPGIGASTTSTID